MTITLGSLVRFHFISLLLSLCSVSPSSLLTIDDLVTGLVTCPPRQSQAFTLFKNEFDTRGCNHSDNSNGVWCDNSTGAVTKLRLRACLSGTLKPNSSLFRLHQLRYLDLSSNHFTSSSSLLSEFGNLNKLEVLSLSFNGFIGEVPSSFNNLTMLSYLGLSHNQLTGSFPFLQYLSNLSYLDLSNNHFSGTLNPNSSLFELHQLITLNLASNHFISPIPSQFGNLNKLQVLALSKNGFFGQVPPTISNLTWLTRLFLNSNELTGSLPLVQNLTNLYDLELSYNHFTGTLPSSLLIMPSLEYIDLRGNNLAGSFEVPNSSTSSRLQVLFLGDNHFEVKTLEPFSKLTNLIRLGLSFLNTSHPIDLTFLSSLKSLFSLDLSGNSISPASLTSDASIPLSIGFLLLSHCNITEFPNVLKTLQGLQHIDISHNGIKGKVPAWLWELPLMSSMDLSNNSFNGFEGSAEVLVNSSVEILLFSANSFQGALPNLPLSITTLSAWGNSFTGNIPLSLCNLNSLMVLDISGNSFTGSVPSCLSNLTYLVLRNNSLKGSLPDMFYTPGSSRLRTFDVGYNQLNGKLPRSLINCTSLKFLNVEYNEIEDAFPFWLKALPNLQVLVLRSNKFYGPIAPLAFPQLHIFEISDNKFNGSLPANYFVNWKASTLQMSEDGSNIYMGYEEESAFSMNGYYAIQDVIDLRYKGLVMEQAKVLSSYATIDFSGNKLEGEVPESIGLLKALIALNLSNNAFTGHIPLSLGNLTQLASLDLSRNNFSGTIPNELKGLTFLAYLNLSHNQLTGEIPQGTQIIGQPKSSFEGNGAGLCGIPLEESCLRTSAPLEGVNQGDEEEGGEVLNWKAVAIGYAPGVLFGLALGQVIASYKPKWLLKLSRLY